MVLKFIVLMTLMFFEEWCKMRHTIKSAKNATKEKKMTVINRIQAIHSWCETKSNVHCSSNSNVLFFRLSRSLALSLFFHSLALFIAFHVSTYCLFICWKPFFFVRIAVVVDVVVVVVAVVIESFFSLFILFWCSRTLSHSERRFESKQFSHFERQ